MTGEQIRAFSAAVLEAVRLEAEDRKLVARIQRRTVAILESVGAIHGGSMTALCALLDSFCRPPGAPPRVDTFQHQTCKLHTEPGPEYIEAPDGRKLRVRDGMRARWEEECAVVFRHLFVGTCHTNRCDPELPGAAAYYGPGSTAVPGFAHWRCNQPPPPDEGVRAWYGPGANPFRSTWLGKPIRP